MKNLSVKAKLIVVFIACLGFINILGFYGLYAMSQTVVNVKNIAIDCMDGILSAKNMRDLATDMHMYELEIIVSTDSNVIAQGEKARLDISKKITDEIQTYIGTINNAYYETPAEKEQDIKLITDVKAKWQNYENASSQVIELQKQGKNAQAKLLFYNASEKEMAKLLEAVDAISSYNKESADLATKITLDIYAKSKMIFITLQALCFLLTLLLFYALYQSIEKPIEDLIEVSKKVGSGDLSVQANIFANDEIGVLAQQYNLTIAQIKNLVVQLQNTSSDLNKSAEFVKQSIEQTAEATQSVASNTSIISNQIDEQATAITQTTIMIDKVAQDIQVSTELTTGSAKVARDALDKTHEGVELIKQLSFQMNQIAMAAGGTADAINNLGNRSNEIGTITQTISEISSQTNLLALNAAIEAARAGEHGRGFSVVAEEVRKLAEQSQKASEKIANLIKMIQKETNDAINVMAIGKTEVQKGIEAVGKSGVAFEQIAKMSEDNGEYIEQISERMNIVLTSINEIIKHAEQIQNSSNIISTEVQSTAASSQEQTATVQEIASSSHVLAELAEKMGQLTRKFKI